MTTFTSLQAAHARISIALAAGQGVISTTKAKPDDGIPEAYCERGHHIHWNAKLSAGKVYKCAFCGQSAKVLRTCHCGRGGASDFFVCPQCLKEGKSFTPPPSCPSLQCVGICSRRFSSLSKKCSQCPFTIPAGQHHWQCKECRTMSCNDCQPPSTFKNPLLQHLDLAPPTPPPHSHSACSTSLTDLRNGQQEAPDPV